MSDSKKTSAWCSWCGVDAANDTHETTCCHPDRVRQLVTDLAAVQRTLSEAQAAMTEVLAVVKTVETQIHRIANSIPVSGPGNVLSNKLYDTARMLAPFVPICGKPVPECQNKPCEYTPGHPDHGHGLVYSEPVVRRTNATKETVGR